MQLQGTAQYESFAAVTKSDTTLVTCRAIYVGGTGHVAISPDSTTAAVTISAVPVGTILPIALNGGRIMSTTTTATLMVALA
jgi:hypothetical protein